MRSFKELFEDYGADYQTTMERFMGKEEMYLRFLDMLFDDPSMGLLGDALDCSDMVGAFRAAHTLKGVVGNMGLTPLYKTVCTIVEPLRTGQQRDDYSALYQAIEMEFQRADELRSLLKGGAQ